MSKTSEQDVATVTNGYTPGPWAIDERSPRHPKVFNTTYDIYIADVRQAESGLDSAEATANARLIAAAPDLLTAGRKMMAFLKDLSDSNPGFMGRMSLQNYQQWNEAMMELPAAIAKATK